MMVVVMMMVLVVMVKIFLVVAVVVVGVSVVMVMVVVVVMVGGRGGSSDLCASILLKSLCSEFQCLACCLCLPYTSQWWSWGCFCW